MDEYVVPLAELAPSSRTAGGKAANLARLVAAGLPVPPAVAILTTAPRNVEKILKNSVLRDFCAVAGGPLAVRSSAVIEDGRGAAAPGVFASVLGVDAGDAAAVGAAIERVWASARSPLARRYAAARGLDEDIAIAVIVQRQVGDGAAGARGQVYTRPPGQPQASVVWLEAGDDDLLATARLRRPQSARSVNANDGDAGDAGADGAGGIDGAGGAGGDSLDDGFPLDADRASALLRLALAAESAIDAPAGADVEWVEADGALWLVQARPIVHPATARAPMPAALLAFSRAEPDLVWTWDAEHNPDPLSPIQRGLVERMDVAAVAPFRMRVVGGYLYTAIVFDSRTFAAVDAELGDTSAALRRDFERSLLPAMEEALADAEAPSASLEDIIDAYRRFYAIYVGVLAPRLEASQRALPAFLRRHLGVAAERRAGRLLADASPARLETLIARTARGELAFDALLAEVGPLAPAWDVLAPSYAERPAALEAAVARARACPAPGQSERVEQLQAETRDALPLLAREAFDAFVAQARVARDLAERDDRLFGRAQAAVRRAVLAAAAALGLDDPEDGLYLPLDSLCSWSDGGEAPDPIALRRLAQAARAARERERSWVPPRSFVDGRSRRSPRRGGGDVWTGVGTGGRVTGPVIRLAELSDASAAPADISPEAVLVVAAVTPAMTPALIHAAAVVSEHGGLLGHGAAMARELGIPCVVDCAGAWSELGDGDRVTVDGDAGLVTRAGPLWLARDDERAPAV